MIVIARRVGERGPLQGKPYFEDGSLEKFIPDTDYMRVPHISVNASKSLEGNKVYLVVINKNMDQGITSTIDLKDFIPASEGNAWVLNRSIIDATNEKNHDHVKVTHKKFQIWSERERFRRNCEFTFEPHSLTAVEIERI